MSRDRRLKEVRNEESRANIAGLKAMLDADCDTKLGSISPEAESEFHLGVDPARPEEVVVVREVGESIPLHIEVVNDALEVVAERTIQVDPEHTEQAIEEIEDFEREVDNATPSLEEQLAAAKALIAKLEKENTT